MKTTCKYDFALILILSGAVIFCWHDLRKGQSLKTCADAASVVAGKLALVNHPAILLGQPVKTATYSGKGISVLEDSAQAPAWTVKYGGEFWQHSLIAPGHTGRPNDVHSAVSPSFSLGEVMERVNHALVQGKTSTGPELAAGNYLARFDGQGLTFSPYLPATQNSLVPTIDSSAEIKFQTASIQRDGNPIYTAGLDGQEWSAVGNTAQSLLSKDWGVVEHYEAQNQGVSVAWVFPAALPGSGAVEVSAYVSGLTYAGHTDGGFHLADANGMARVRISNAYAVDSVGNRWELPMTMAPNDGLITITLPADIQSRAVYPLAIDPVVGPEFGMDKAVPGPASGAQANPAVASLGTNYLVVWSDSRDAADTGSDIFGARVTRAGTVLDPVGIAICRAYGNQNNPSLVVVSNTALVVWDDQRLGGDTIFGARVSPLGQVLDAQGIPLSASLAGQFHPKVAAGSTNFFVVWEDDRNSSTNGSDIYGARVAVSGFVLDPAGIPISMNPANQHNPSVTGISNGFFVAWDDNRNFGTTGTDIYGARVSNAGVVLDPNGVALTTTIRNQILPSAVANAGSVLVVWQNRRTSSSQSDGIYGTRLNFTNNAVNVMDTNGISICTNTASQQYPAVCALTNEFLVVWRDSRNNSTASYDLYGSRVDTNGVVLDPAGFVICTNAASQNNPALVGSAAGAFVAWSDGRNATGRNIYGTRISNAGAVVDSNSLPVSLSGAPEVNPVVAFNGTNYLVVWEDYRNFAVSDVDIRGSRVSSAGAVLDPAGINICNQTAAQHHPSVAASGGEFLVAWADARNAVTTGVDIYGARISGGGVVLDPSGLALSQSANDEANPAVAANSSSFLVAWEDNRNNNGVPDIFATLVSQSGLIINPSGLPITQNVGNGGNHPAVAAGTNQFLVAWDDGSDVYAARVAKNGTVLDPSGSSLQLAYNGNEVYPSVGALGGNFLVAWQDFRNTTYDIFAGRVLSDGTMPDNNGFPICTLPNNQINPVVGATTNLWLVVWQNTGTLDGNDLYCARVGPNGGVQDYLSVPLVGTADRTSPQLAFNGNQFLLVSDAFRTNSVRVVGSLVNLNSTQVSPTIQFSLPNYTVLETAKFAKITITLIGKFNGCITVDFSTSDGSAVAGVDYLPTASRLVFSPKQVSTTVMIPIIDNGGVELNKTVNLNLQNTMGGPQIGLQGTATLTIIE